MLEFTQLLRLNQSTETKANTTIRSEESKRNRREEINGKAKRETRSFYRGKTKEEVTKEVNTARFEKRHDLLIEHAKQLGIDTEGKKMKKLF